MKRIVTVTHRLTYEVDVDDILVELANYRGGDCLGDFGDILDDEVVLVEIGGAVTRDGQPSDSPFAVRSAP